MDIFADTVEAIYSASIEPLHWPVAVRSAAMLMHSDGAVLLTPMTGPESGGFIFADTVEGRFLQAWGSKYVHLDPWAPRARDRGLFIDGATLLSDDILPRAELEASEFYQDFFLPMGYGYMCTGVVFGVGHASFPPTNCTFLNRLEREDFGPEHREYLKLIVRHFSRALGIMFALRDAEFRVALTTEALDRIAVGVVILRGDRTVVSINRAAQEMLDEQDGVSLRHERFKSYVLPWKQSDCEQLDEALRNAIDPFAANVGHFLPPLAITRPSGKAPYLAYASTLNASSVPGYCGANRHAIVVLRDTSRKAVLDEKLLRKLFGFTATELRVISKLAEGVSLVAAVVSLGFSRNTMKSHVRNIYRKAGVQTHVELVMLLESFRTDDIQRSTDRGN